MAYENTIGILITAKDDATPVLAQVSATAKATSAATSANLKAVANDLKSTGSVLTSAVTIPVVALAALSGDLAYKFNNAMELLHTSAGIPQSAIASLSSTVLDMASSLGQSPEALAQGLYHVASAGNGIWNTAQQLDILKVAAQGANLGLASLDDTTYALTSAMASGVKGASNASEMMAVLVATVGAGDMKMADLNGALSTGILSTAATFGISIQSVGSALATLTDNGEHADEAATRLRMTLALMSSPSSMAAKQLEALGLTAEDAKKSTEGMNAVFAQSGLTTTKLADDLRQPNGIAVAIEDLKTHLQDAGLSASEADAMLSKAFGGGRTDAALLTMLQNTDRLDAKFKTINADSGTMQSKLNDLNSTPNQKLRDAWTSMQASLIRIGNDLLPLASKLLTTVAGDVSSISKWWTSLDSGQKTALEWLIGALAIGGPVLKGTDSLIRDVQTVGSLFSDLKTVAAPAFAFLADQFSGLATTVIPNVKDKVSDLFSKIGAGTVMGGVVVAGALADIALVSQAVQSVQNAISAMNAAASSQENAANSKATAIDAVRKGFASGHLTKAQYDTSMNNLNAIDTKSQNFGDYLAQWWNGIMPKFAGGTSFAPGGMSLVGENGPELVNLPRGSQVSTASQTQQMLGANKGVTINGGMHIHNEMDEQRFLAKLGFRLATA